MKSFFMTLPIQTAPTLPFQDYDTPLQKCHKLFKVLQRASTLRKCINSLYFAYHIGEIIHSSPDDKAKIKKLLSTYFDTFSSRIHYIFEADKSQILNTKSMTLRTVYTLKKEEYYSLCSDVLDG